MATKKYVALLSIIMYMVGTKALAYNLAVKNADGVTIYYNYIKNGKELEVTAKDLKFNSNRCYNGIVVIPETVTYMNTTRKVTSIGYKAFYHCIDMTSVTIPNSVASIGELAFYGCHGLTSVTIPRSVTRIERNAFASCRGLTSVTIPNSVKSIGYGVFNSCGLTSVTIPNSVTSIGEYAFSGCSSLSSVTIPNSVKSIEACAFSGCISLTSIIIPNSVNSLDISVFAGCSGLTSVEIPNSVTKIEASAFSGCSSLTSVTIPSSVTSIGSGAFYGCGSLNIIISLNNIPPKCEQYSGSYDHFYSVDKINCVVWVPKGRVNAYREAGGWNDFHSIRELALGDANGDNYVNAADIVETVNAMNGHPSDKYKAKNADVDCNDMVNQADIEAIVKIILNLK